MSLKAPSLFWCKTYTPPKWRGEKRSMVLWILKCSKRERAKHHTPNAKQQAKWNWNSKTSQIPFQSPKHLPLVLWQTRPVWRNREKYQICPSGFKQTARVTVPSVKSMANLPRSAKWQFYRTLPVLSAYCMSCNLVFTVYSVKLFWL